MRTYRNGPSEDNTSSTSSPLQATTKTTGGCAAQSTTSLALSAQTTMTETYCMSKREGGKQPTISLEVPACEVNVFYST